MYAPSSCYRRFPHPLCYIYLALLAVLDCLFLYVLNNTMPMPMCPSDGEAESHKASRMLMVTSIDIRDPAKLWSDRLKNCRLDSFLSTTSPDSPHHLQRLENTARPKAVVLVLDNIRLTSFFPRAFTVPGNGRGFLQADTVGVDPASSPFEPVSPLFSLFVSPFHVLIPTSLYPVPFISPT